MNKLKIILLVLLCWVPLIISLVLPYQLKTAQPEYRPEPVDTVNDVKIVQVHASAFCEYGFDDNGIDYGPGYVIISDKSEIPLYSLLDIDVYGQAQAVAVSSQLAADEINLWYNAQSKVMLFEPRTAYVRIIGEGDQPCK